MLTMLVLGAAGSVVGVGTFATFNASVTSTGNTFSTGTISFSSTSAGSTTCTSTNGATASGSGCSTALGTLASMVPGDSKFLTTTLTNSNSSTVPVTVNMAVTDASSGGTTALDNKGINAAATSSAGPMGLGLAIFECQDTNGADIACSSSSMQKLKVLYGSCAGGVTTVSRSGAAAFATTDVSSASVTDNGLKLLGTSTECYGGDTGSGSNSGVANQNGTTSISIVGSATPLTSLAANSAYNLLMLAYLPVPSDDTVINIAGTNASPNLTFTWTASSLAGTSH